MLKKLCLAFLLGNCGQLAAQFVPNCEIPALGVVHANNLRAANIVPGGSAGFDFYHTLGAQPLQFHFAGSTTAAPEPETGEHCRLFPNPDAGEVTVGAPGERLREMVFYDAAGRRLRTVPLAGLEKMTAPVGDLPRGLIFVQLRSERAVFVKKLLLEN